VTIRDAVRDRVISLLAEASIDEVDSAHVYARDVPEIFSDRDGLPSIVVSPTPDANTEQVRTASRLRQGFPISVCIVDRHNRELVKTGTDWRVAARSLIETKLCGMSLPGVSTCYGVMMDQNNSLSGQAFRDANLWWAGITLVVWCATALGSVAPGTPGMNIDGGNASSNYSGNAFDGGGA
jgi:hypothetical protein